MPVVPRYGQQRVELAPLPAIPPGGVAPIEAFGGGRAVAGVFGEARGLAQDVAKQQADVLEREYGKANQVAFLEAKNSLTRARMDAELEMRNFKLKDAINAREAVNKRWDKATQETLSKAATPEVKLAVQDFIGRESLTLYGRTESHIAAETDRNDDQEVAARVQLLTDEGVRNSLSPAVIALNAAEIESTYRQYAERRDISGDTFKAGLTKELSHYYTSVISAQADAGQDITAKTTFEEHEKDMTAEDIKRIRSVVNRGSKQGEARRFATEVSESLTQEEALDKLEKKNIQDTDIYDEARRRVRENYALKRQAKEELQDKTYKQIWSYLSELGGDIDMFQAHRDDVTPAMWENLERRAANIRLSKEPVTSRSTLLELTLMAVYEPKKFMNPNLLLDRSEELSREDFERFSKIQTDLIEKGGSAGVRNFQTIDRVTNRLFSSLGFDLTPKPGSAQQEIMADFSFLMDRAADSELQRLQEKDPLKKELSLEEVESLARGLWENVRIPDKKALKKGAENIVFSVMQIPENMRNQTKDHLRNKNGGKEPTNEEVLKFYNNSQVAGEAEFEFLPFGVPLRFQP